MPNVSELARREVEELEQRLAAVKTKASDLHLSKASREYFLAMQRRLERELGIEGEPINGRPAQPVEPSIILTKVQADKLDDALTAALFGEQTKEAIQEALDILRL